MAHFLDDQSDGAFLHISTGNGEGYALALFTEAYYDEVSRFA